MKSFAELGLSPELLHAVTDLGFENPMPVQEEVIPFLLGSGGDLVALAQTGTGKTAAFGLPVIQHSSADSNRTQALVLSPTRELCLQIAADLDDYSRHIPGLRVLAVYGGSSIRNQIDALKKGAQIVVATPGRLLDLLQRGVVDLSAVRDVVMDEADEMLDMGFLEDIDAILAQVPEGKRTTEVTSARVTSRMADFDRLEGVVMFEGDVIVRYSEDYTMCSDRLYVFVAGTNQLSRVVALGNVSITNATRSGDCAMATYRRKKGVVEMFGNGTNALARLNESGENATQLEGTRIRFWLDAEQVEVDNPRISAESQGGMKFL